MFDPVLSFKLDVYRGDVSTEYSTITANHKCLNDVKYRNVVTSQETESAVYVSCDVTTFLYLTPFRLLLFLSRYCFKTLNYLVKIHRVRSGLGSKIVTLFHLWTTQSFRL